MITPDEFFGKYDGKGIDYDHFYGFQCMDLAQQYCKEVVGHQLPPQNAITVINNYPTDVFEFITNQPNNCPIKGDIVLWSQGVGEFGHIAICKDGDINSFTSFDQNWPVGSLCHFQPHSYKYVLGWLRVKPPVSVPEPSVPTPPVIVPPVTPSEPTPPNTEPIPVPQVVSSTSPVPIKANWFTKLINWIRSIKFGK